MLLLWLVLYSTIFVNIDCGFVTRSGSNFMLNGNVYRFAGTNNYYLIYKDQFMVDNVLETAAKKGFKVVRTWGFIDIGYQNGSHSADSNGPIKDGIYFQYWSPDTQSPVYNDTNLRMLDYVLYKAASLNIKILITLTNNWSDFGGMDQYNIYRQLQDPSIKLFHDSFYNDTQIMEWYKNWVKHLIERENYYNNIKYSQDDTIFAWELANEPRCQGSGGKFSSSNTCTAGIYTAYPFAWKITKWVDIMSTYIKSIDNNHMIATGDEGWYVTPFNCGNVYCDGYYGIDSINNTNLTNIDFMSMHLYPQAWGQQNSWGNIWIKNHTEWAHNIVNKPVLLGEYAIQAYSSGSQQPAVYKQWTDTVYINGTNGDLFWMLDGESDAPNQFWVPNYDGNAIYCVQNSSQPAPPGDPATCNVLSKHAMQMLQ